MGKNEVEKEKPEVIGGLTDSGTMSAKPTTSPQIVPDSAPSPVLPPPPATSTLGGGGNPQKPEEGSGGGGALAGLDLFTEETADGEEGNKLAEQLPEVDIQELLQECKDVVAEFASKTTSDSDE